MENNFLFDYTHQVFTCQYPKNTFIIDYSNGYPVQITTNVTRYTIWGDIFNGNYDFANPNRTPEYLLVNGVRYTYIDMKFGENGGYIFNSDNDVITVSIRLWIILLVRMVDGFLKEPVCGKLVQYILVKKKIIEIQVFNLDLLYINLIKK